MSILKYTIPPPLPKGHPEFIKTNQASYDKYKRFTLVLCLLSMQYTPRFYNNIYYQLLEIVSFYYVEQSFLEISLYRESNTCDIYISPKI